MKILTLEEAKKKGLRYYSYHNGDYEYQTKDGIWHLIRDGVDLLKGKRAVDCLSYENDDYDYQTKDGIYHLIRDGVDLLDGKRAVEHLIKNKEK